MAGDENKRRSYNHEAVVKVLLIFVSSFSTSSCGDIQFLKLTIHTYDQ